MAEEVLSQFRGTLLGNMDHLRQVLHDRIDELKGMGLITSVRKSMKGQPMTFPSFSKLRKVIGRVLSFLTNLGAESCKNHLSDGFQVILLHDYGIKLSHGKLYWFLKSMNLPKVATAKPRFNSNKAPEFYSENILNWVSFSSILSNVKSTRKLSILLTK